MALGARVRSLYRTLFRGRQLDRELDDEVMSYVEELTDRHVRRGMSRSAAARAARLEVEGVEHVKELARESRVGIAVEMLLRDVLYGLRALRRTPAFTATVVATLALGIGASITMFSVTRTVLWQPLPYPAADRLVLLSADARGLANAGLAGGEVRDLHDMRDVFEQVATVVGVSASLDIDGHLEHVMAASANDEALALLGGTPLALGRPLEAARDIPAEFVSAVLVSDRIWRSRLGANPGVVGRRIQVNNLDVQVAGVVRPDVRVIMPADANTAEEIDVWFPRPFASDRRARTSSTIARLRPDITFEALKEQLDVLSARWTAGYPEDYAGAAFRLWAKPLQEVVTAGIRSAVLLLGGAVALVLLIGYVNVANLMLARADARRQEFVMRRALGGSRGRLLAHVLAESVALAATGAVAGLCLAAAGVRAVEWLRPTHLPRQSQIALDASAMWVALVLAVGGTVVIGLVQMRRSNDSNVDVLRSARARSRGANSRRLQRTLIVTEVALSVAPLFAAGLMLRTFVNLVEAPLGFNPETCLRRRCR